MAGDVLSLAFVRYLASLGVGGVIAGLMFMWYRKDVRVYTDQWKGQTELLMKVVTENTRIIALNTEVVRALASKIDRMDDH